MTAWLRHGAMALVDWWMALIPRTVPGSAVLRQCKIISHRGEHDNKKVLENTLYAWDIARTNGVWGIEADIRWTRDLVPVIIHDPDTERIFGETLTVGELSFADLRAAMPQIPSLAELIDRFGGNTHLMLEIKAEVFPDLERQKHTLRQHLSTLRPAEDYHLLALDPELFEQFDIQPRRACLPVSQLNARAMSAACLAGGYGGFTGHFLLLNGTMQRRHARHGQPLGTGYVRSRNCLFRELNRGITWIFTNDAVKLQKIVTEALDKQEGA